MVKANPLRIGVLRYLFLESHRLFFCGGRRSEEGCFLKSGSPIPTASVWVWSCCLCCVVLGLSKCPASGCRHFLHLLSAPVSKALSRCAEAC